MRRTMTTALVSAAALLVGSSGATSRKAVPAASSRSFTIRYTVHVPTLPAGSHELQVWAPMPYQGPDSFQSISQIQIESPVKYRIERQAEYGDRYAYLAVNASQVRDPFEIRVSFHATRYEHRVGLTPSGDSPFQ